MDISQQSHCIEIPPALAKAIVAAQSAGESLRRDSTGDKGKYTTADEIAFVARKALTEHGAAWVRLDVSLESPALAQSDIGKQAYVGDLVERWAIVHEGGWALLGSSRMPVITSMGRPHDKAVGASLTYDVGGALRGALCMDREDKNAIDRRADDEPQATPPPEQPKQQRKPEPTLGSTKKGEPLIKAIVALIETVAQAMSVDADRVWRGVAKSTGAGAPDVPSLTFKAAAAVKAKLEAKLEEIAAALPGAEQPKSSAHADSIRLWARLLELSPEDFNEESWKADWAKFAGLKDGWPDRPTEAHYVAAHAGMHAALKRIEAP